VSAFSLVIPVQHGMTVTILLYLLLSK